MIQETHNMSVGALLLLAVLFASYAIGAPAESAPEKAAAQAELQERFSRPVVQLPISQPQNTAPTTASVADSSQSSRSSSTNSVPAEAESILVWDSEAERALYTKNASTTRPIASITKLITAAVVLQEATIDEITTISPQAVGQEGNAGELRPDEQIRIEALLHILLLESSNDAAAALAEHIESQKDILFTDLMNTTAQQFSMNNSRFTGPAGLNDESAYSTAHDIARLISALRTDPLYAPLWQILQKPRATVYSHDAAITHTLTNNNPFVGELSSVVGGKTGYTHGAGESLTLVTTQPDGQGEIIYILLGSTDRFSEMRKLINWTVNSFAWQN